MTDTGQPLDDSADFWGPEPGNRYVMGAVVTIGLVVLAAVVLAVVGAVLFGIWLVLH